MTDVQLEKVSKWAVAGHERSLCMSLFGFRPSGNLIRVERKRLNYQSSCGLPQQSSPDIAGGVLVDMEANDPCDLVSRRSCEMPGDCGWSQSNFEDRYRAQFWTNPDDAFPVERCEVFKTAPSPCDSS